MAKLVLSEAQEMQLNQMMRDKKDNKEIKDFFKATYSVDLPGWKLNYARSKVMHPAGSKRTYKKRGGGTEQALDDVKVDDLVKILQQIDGGYKQILKKIRGELIKSRAQVYEMMRSAGIEVKEDEV